MAARALAARKDGVTGMSCALGGRLGGGVLGEIADDQERRGREKVTRGERKSWGTCYGLWHDRFASIVRLSSAHNRETN